MALEQAGVQLIAAGGDVYITTINKAESATQNFVSTTEQGGGKISAVGQVMTGALREIGRVAIDALGQAAKATADFLKDSVSVAGDFEAGMHKFQAVAGKSVDTKGLEQFHDLFIQLGKDLPVSTSEVQQAAIEMVSGGIDPAIVAGGALKQTLQFAAASGLSLADAAATSAKFLAGWTDSAATAEQKVAFLASSTDALTKAAAASSTNAAQLRLGLFNVQGAAQALHAPFEDVVATLGLLAPAFESSAQAGTALNVFMTRLVPQTKPATEAMQALGIITKDNQNLFFDTQGNFLGMANAAQVLQEHLSGLTDEQKIAELHTLFGNDAMKVANLLMQDGAAGMEAFKAKMAEANGVQDTAALMLSGYNTALENAKGSVEALKITVGEKLLPVLTDLLNNTIAPAINAFTNWADKILSAEDPLKELVAQIDTFSPALGTVVAAIGDLIATGGDLGVALDDISEGFDVNLSVLKDIPKAFDAVTSAFSSSGDAADSLGKVIDDLSGIFNSYLKTVQDVLGGYMAIAQAVLPIVEKFWTEHGQEIKSFITDTYNTIIDIIRTAIQLYDAIVPPVLRAVADLISSHSNEIQTVLTGAWNVISGVIQAALALIQGILHVALDVIHDDWSKAWEDLKTMTSNVADGIVKAITGLFEIVAGLFGTNLAKIGELWQHNWDMLVEIAGKIADRMVAIGSDVVAGIQRGIGNAWGSFLSWVQSKIDLLPKAVRDALGIGSPSKVMMPIGGFIIEGLTSGMQDALPLLDGIIDDMTMQLIGNIHKMSDQVRDEIDKSIASMKQQIKGAQDAIANLQISGFQSDASIARQKVSNLDALDELSAGGARAAREQLKNAEEIAATINDPKQAADYFAMRSKQIFEEGKLIDQMNATNDAAEKKRLNDRFNLIHDANLADMKAFDAQAKQGSQTRSLATQLQQLLGASISGGGQTVGLPGILDNAVMASFASLLQQLTSPPAQGGTGGGAIGGGATYNSRTLNMPIYTNMSPSAVQNSAAIANAMLP